MEGTEEDGKDEEEDMEDKKRHTDNDGRMSKNVVKKELVSINVVH